LLKRDAIKKTPIAKLFLSEANRFENFFYSIAELNLSIDFSKQHIDLEALGFLCDATKYLELDNKIQDLFYGKELNVTENRRVWHTQLRDPHPIQEITNVLQKIQQFTEELYQKDIQNILYLGIGGSCLGPEMVCQALDKYTNSVAKNYKFYFIANAAKQSMDNILQQLDPTKTIVIIASKSFTTAETLLNAKLVIDWLHAKLPVTLAKYLYGEQIFAITSNTHKALDFGIKLENIFPFWDFVGGRYSVWSAVGLPIAIKLGFDNFKKFLYGGYLLDQHFQQTIVSKNIPIIMALISIWNINFMNYNTLAVIPYLNELHLFVDYLQQLSMESNGKTINVQNKQIDYNTVEIIWGGIGCNVQHSFMQMLHQGSQVVPVDFMLALKNEKFLLANCLAQSQALMQGTNIIADAGFGQQQSLPIFKQCSGNRPSSTIIFPELTPEVLGGLIALYEHKNFVQGIMWNINSFDQWGVELGKNLATKILNMLGNANKDQVIDNYSNDDILLQQSTIELVKKSTLIY
jgi:glucose-6-phosphate isomerase